MKSHPVLDVVINTDDNYIQHAMAMLCSLYENNIDQNIHLHVLTGLISEKSKNYIETLTLKYNNKVYWYFVDDKMLEGVHFRKNRPLSYAAYYRLLLAEVLPDCIKTVLYLDCDIIVLKDISEIFNLEIENYALAASIDTFPYSSIHRQQLQMEADERTFCSGIMLVNLDYWRENNVTDHLLAFAKIKREPTYLHDQDVLNYVFKKKWFLLPPKWNRVASAPRAIRNLGFRPFDYSEYAIDPILIHYAAVTLKPWYNGVSPHKSLYKKYLYLSRYNDVKFKNIPIKERIKNLILTYRYTFKLIVIKLFKYY